MTQHPDLAAEQEYLASAYRRLDEMRAAVEENLAEALAQSRGLTPQGREQRDVVVRSSLQRLQQLDVGELALCFGRIDFEPDEEGEEDAYHIGRLAVSGRDQEPLVVDWRAPIAEPFYRATPLDAMGLARRRHFITEGRGLVGIEDEVFRLGAGADGEPSAGPGPAGREETGADGGPGEAEESGDQPLATVPTGALLAALSRSRSGRMRDIAATIQKEQDEAIRAPLPGLLVIQGGPGTGKTAVALHRAAYLLYTYRFPLERQGVLVVGPNPLFLRYIDQVLPSLGESGAVLSTIDGLVGQVRPRAEEPPGAAALKGDARMAAVVAAAVRDRERGLRRDLAVPFGSVVLHLPAARTESLVASVRRRAGTHNAKRRLLESLVLRELVDQAHQSRAGVAWRTRDESGSGAPGRPGERGEGAADEELEEDLRRHPEVAAALDRMWPRLRPEELLHDLYGARPLLRLAGRGRLSAEELALLFRPRSEALEDIPWTRADLPLLDEARVLLGPPRTSRDGGATPTYGHIVVDETQDLTPMQLRMIGRRSLSGSMTVVGDLAQATGPHRPGSWEEVIAHLGRDRAGARSPTSVVELSICYRTPAEVMELAAPVLRAAGPGLSAPRPIRRSGTPPLVVQASEGELLSSVAAAARAEAEAVGDGTAAVVCTRRLAPSLAAALREAGLQVGDAGGAGVGSRGLVAPLTVVPIDLVKGLEFDSVVVVEPARILAEATGGARALYVALTRPTRRLVVVHAEPLPEVMRLDPQTPPA
jgi:DNA helicase IV